MILALIIRYVYVHPFLIIFILVIIILPKQFIYLQKLLWEIIEFYFTEGSRDQFGLQTADESFILTILRIDWQEVKKLWNLEYFK